MPVYRAQQASGSLTVRKNSGADVGSRPRVNVIEGAGVTLTVTDDPGSAEIDLTIARAAAVGGAYTLTGVNTDRVINTDLTTLNELLNVVGTLIQDLQSIGVVT